MKYSKLLHELFYHQYFSSLKTLNWKEFRVGQIIIASVLINLLELASPVYINIIYSVILPRAAMESLIFLTALLVVLLLLSAWLKAMRLDLIGEDSARVTHSKRIKAISHFVSIPISRFLESSPSKHISSLNSINLLKDESAIESLTTAIDLLFSFAFILFLFMIGGIIAIPVIIGIAFYFLKSLSFAKEYELVSKEQDELELQRITTQIDMIDSVDLIKVNGLNSQFLTSVEPLHESLSWRRMKNNQCLSNHQAFGSLINQATLALLVTVGAILVINDRLLVGALAASILLSGKIFQPWQKLSTLWSSYRSLTHSQDEYTTLMNTPILLDNHLNAKHLDSTVSLSTWSITTRDIEIQNILPNKANFINSHSYEPAVKQLFANFILADSNQTVLFNNIQISQFDSTELIDNIAYVNPSHQFFNGSLIQNLTSFQPSKFKRSALFWSFMLGIDQKIKCLPMGYETPLGNHTLSGLSSDEEKLLHIVSGLSVKPLILLMDLNDCTFGHQFIDGMQMIIERCRGRMTLLIAGSSPIFNKISDNTIQPVNSNKSGVA